MNRRSPGWHLTLTLALPSSLAVALLIARVARSGSLRFGFLAWNLALAWVPYGLALLARRVRGVPLAAVLVGWLLFLPNAPYVVTDLVHLPRSAVYEWHDLGLVAAFALACWFLGMASLHITHDVLESHLNAGVAWIVVGGAALASGVGVYVGRVLRWNSWDPITDPAMLLRAVGVRLADPFGNTILIGFVLLFGGLFLSSYVVMRTLATQSSFSNQATSQ